MGKPKPPQRLLRLPRAENNPASSGFLPTDRLIRTVRFYFSSGAEVDGRASRRQFPTVTATVNYKIGNEKLVRVLDGASSHLRGLLDRQGRPDGALRIAVVGGGCSGLQYKMDLVDGPRDRDILVPSNGVNVVIDPKSALFVSGSELDFSDDLQQGGFKVSNPNAVVTCSCGESFAA